MRNAQIFFINMVYLLSKLSTTLSNWKEMLGGGGGGGKNYYERTF
jgi:hypothetical protein